MSDLISVIVPVYNDRKYIDKCINCILSQTYRNIELLLIVDGATDGSEEVCRSYEKKDERVRVIVKENGGTADTRNRGLDEAKGDYIAFMDTDDYASESYLEVLYNGISNSGADISAIGLQEVSEFDQIITNAHIYDEYIILDKEEAIRNLFNDDLYGNFVWNKMYRKKLFDNVRFKKVYKIEDLAVMYLIFDQINFLCYNRSKLYFYAQRQKSQLHKKELSIFTIKLNIVRERYEYIKNKYPNILDNYVDYAQTIIECYPYIFYKKDLREIMKKDMKDLLPFVKDHLSEKEKRKISLYRLK